SPRLLVEAEGMYYTSSTGSKVIDSSAGLWCVNAGHKNPRIVKAIQNQLTELDYAPTFQVAHPKVFELANKVRDLAPEGMEHVFFTNSGSEAVESALKIALAYHRAKGEGQRTRLIGRERGYHGVNIGGISVGGIVNNRKVFGTLLTGVDHLRHTHLPEVNSYSRGQPEHGVELAEDLERICALHGPETIAAVIIEPVAGSTGVLVPPKGYLERVREICTKHGILLIFDEVITGFGRLGDSFAAMHYGITPDMITCAKGLTNGIIPMGGVVVKKDIYDAFMTGPEYLIELFHGYTYSGNPVASAAGIATLETYREEGLFERAKSMTPYWEDCVHSLKGLPNVIDIRNEGMIGAIELEPIPGAPGKRGFDLFVDAFEKGLLIRITGDIIAMSPPLIAEKSHLDEIIGILEKVLKEGK
ncbi:MAG: aspartate aminotransferase family protein, partial [Rhodobacteraceae bacterium]|nr:aspartate aminotransferase family protein [Paracoccaceae bacterium]